LHAAGDYDNAIDYLVNVGGIAREDDYEYLGQDNFCGKDFMTNSDKHSSRLVKVKVGSVLLTAKLNCSLSYCRMAVHTLGNPQFIC
jgi:hypothetical protein